MRPSTCACSAYLISCMLYFGIFLAVALSNRKSQEAARRSGFSSTFSILGASPFVTHGHIWGTLTQL